MFLISSIYISSMHSLHLNIIFKYVYKIECLINAQLHQVVSYRTNYFYNIFDNQVKVLNLSQVKPPKYLGHILFEKYFSGTLTIKSLLGYTINRQVQQHSKKTRQHIPFHHLLFPQFKIFISAFDNFQATFDNLYKITIRSA